MNKKLYFIVLLSPNIVFADIIDTCAGEPMPVIEDKYKIIFANTFGIIPDSGNDISEALQDAIVKANQLGVGIYLPSGSYIINKDLNLKKSTSLVGSPTGQTHLQSNTESGVLIGDITYSNEVSNVLIENLILDNITLEFYGRKWGNKIRYNALVNSKKTQWATIYQSLSLRGGW